MTRAHVRETVLDRAGNALPSVSVLVCDPDTTTPISATIFAASSGGATLSNPLTTDANGGIEFFLVAEAELDLICTISTVVRVVRVAALAVAPAFDLFDGLILSTAGEFDQSIPEDNEVALDLGNLDILVDTANYFDALQPTILTMPRDGVYDFKIHFRIDAVPFAAVYWRYRQVFSVNGGSGGAGTPGLPGEIQVPGVLDNSVGSYDYNSERMSLLAGDEVRCMAYHLRTGGGGGGPLDWYVKSVSVKFEGARP
jgi:hypothetical protein